MDRGRAGAPAWDTPPVIGGELPGCCDVMTILTAGRVADEPEEYGRYRRAHWLALGRPPAEVLARVAAHRAAAEGATP